MRSTTSDNAWWLPGSEGWLEEARHDVGRRFAAACEGGLGDQHRRETARNWRMRGESIFSSRENALADRAERAFQHSFEKIAAQ